MATKKVTTKAKPKKTAKSSAVSKKTTAKTAFAKLRRWNIIIAVLLALQAIAVLIIAKASTLPVVARYLAKDSIASQTAGQTVLSPAVRQMFFIDIRYLIVAFLLVSAITHWLIATVRRNSYEAGLQKRVNTLRWIDYAVSSGIMLILIAMLNGVYDVATLLTVLVLVALLHFLAYFGEAKVGDARAKLQIFGALCVAGATAWLIIASYLKGSIIYGDGLNHAVYWIDGIIVAITLGLAYNKLQLFRQKGRWADYIFGEKVFMALSFTAKVALTWLVFAGFLK